MQKMSLFVFCLLNVKQKIHFKILHRFHCSMKQNVSFVSCSTNGCPRKSDNFFIWHCYISKTMQSLAKKDSKFAAVLAMFNFSLKSLTPFFHWTLQLLNRTLLKIWENLKIALKLLWLIFLQLFSFSLWLHVGNSQLVNFSLVWLLHVYLKLLKCK